MNYFKSGGKNSGKEGTKDGGPSGDHTFFLHCVEQNWKDQSLRQSSENLS